MIQNAKKIFGSKKWFVKCREQKASNEREPNLSTPRPETPQSISKQKGRPGSRVSSSATVRTKAIPSQRTMVATEHPNQRNLLRIGRVSVAIRRLSAGLHQLGRDPAGQEPAGKVQLDRDQLFARDRHSIERGFLCL